MDCDVCDGYHYNELDHIIEIVDPESGEVLPYGEEGEVVLTNIARDCMPLVRYRTGDIAKLEKSVCGSHLDVLGHIVRRKEGAYVLHGHKLFPALFDETLFATDGLLDYRIFSDGDKLTFEIETLDPECFDSGALRDRLSALDVMLRLPEPEIVLLPCGALREYCFEKKRIMEVYDLHGNVYKNTCLKCRKSHDVRLVKYSEGIPYCECGGIIRPGIVLFGETPDSDVIFGCVKEIAKCDLLIAAGTSLRVSSARRLLDGFKGTLVILNNDETALDNRAELIVRGKMGEIFSALCERLNNYE